MTLPGIESNNRSLRSPRLRVIFVSMAAILMLPAISHAQTDSGSSVDAHTTPVAHLSAKAKNEAKGKAAKKVKTTSSASDGMKGRDHSKMEGMDDSKMEGMDHSQMKGMDHGEMKGMDHSQMEGMDHGQMKGMDHSQMEGMDHTKMEGMDHSEMKGMDHGKMEGMDHRQMEGMDHTKMEGMDHGEMKGMDHSQMEGMDHSQMKGMDHTKMEGMNHSQMDGMDMGSMNMQGGSAPPDARSPDYSDGVSSGPMIGMEDMHGEPVLGMVLIDRLEQFYGDNADGQSIDAQAWVGTDLSKLWFKLEGERSDGHLGSSRAELLWNRAISRYWGVQTGVRHDFGEGPSRNWAAFGFQGLAPYWFDVEATAYVGESGRTALRLEAEYELLLTQRLILQPDVEVNFYGKNDPAREIGSGLSDIDFGLRLRYEFTRKFAPYVGVVWSRKFGKTASYARESNGDVDDTQLVAGLRLWF